MTADPEEHDRFTCPRCGQTVEERFFGPCRACRGHLVAHYRTSVESEPAGEGSGTARFEPAMHVVPNHVATKD